MKVNPLRTLARFPKEEGFELGWVGEPGGFALVRASHLPDLFDQVWVDSAGQGGEAVSAYIGVSVVRGQGGTKGLVELTPLAEIAGVPERGYTLITKKNQTLEWEGRLAAVAGVRAKEFADAKGQGLLASTAAARSAAARYFGWLDAGSESNGSYARLRDRATPEHIEKARRLARWPGVLRFEEGHALYDLAALCLVLFEETVEGTRGHFCSADPLENSDVMWRIQLLVDLLARKDRPAAS